MNPQPFAVKEQNPTISTARSPVADLFCPLEFKEIASRGYGERDADGVLHIVPISGGHDSTALALLLKDREPRPYTYVCTPTGNELPEMFDQWQMLGSLLGSRVIPIMEGRTLYTWSRQQKAIPNRKMRHCTPGLKILPLARWLATLSAEGPIVIYVGLRADEEAREGAIYPKLLNVSQRFPLREWGMDDPAVLGFLEQRGITVPERTDCAVCYHQQIGEWWRLWHDHLPFFLEGEAFEAEMGQTFRTPRLHDDGLPIMATRYGHTFASCWRDTWPVRLTDMRIVFEAGHVPQYRADPRTRDLFRSGACRACSL
jgi:3'-phosphoadenosine 5'-phosphosulfate sulfotransferase (PAPS reductase)/FAD synthetase